MKPSKILSLIFCLLFAAAASAFAQPTGGTKDAAEGLWRAIERGETGPAFWQLVDLYRRNGAHIAAEGPWKLNLTLQDYREIVNVYTNRDVNVRLSRMTATEAEAADYWENWSRVLTAGSFDHQRFFKNDRERFLMANYNTLVLAAHEIGHYLDFRHKMSDHSRDGSLRGEDLLNCSEGYADRFAVGVVNHLAALDARFRRMRPRYLELVKKFNAAVPPRNRYHFASYDAVGDEKCRGVNLLKNGVDLAKNSVDENFFRQYASAYFNRHRLMLENPNYPGSLAQVVERELLAPYFARLDYSARRVSVRTLGEYDGKAVNDIYFEGPDFREMVEFYSDSTNTNDDKTDSPVKLRDTVLNEKGEVRHLEIGWTAKKILHPEDRLIFKESDFTLTLLGADEKPAHSFKVRLPADLKNNYVFSKFLLPTDGEIVAVMLPFEMKRKFDHVALLHLLEAGGGWAAPRLLKFATPNLADADEIASGWFVTPAGRLNVLRRQTVEKSDAVNLALYEVDREDFGAKLKNGPFAVRMKTTPTYQSMKRGLWREFYWHRGAFGNDAGLLFLSGGETHLGLKEDDANLFELAAPEARALLGNLNGVRDGDDPRRIQISSPIAARFTGEKRVIFLDKFAGKTYLRELILR